MHNFWLYLVKLASQWVWLNDTFFLKKEKLHLYLCVFTYRDEFWSFRKMSNISGNRWNWPSEIEFPGFWVQWNMKGKCLRTCPYSWNEIPSSGFSFHFFVGRLFFFLLKEIAFTWFSDEQYCNYVRREGENIKEKLIDKWDKKKQKHKYAREPWWILRM